MEHVTDERLLLEIEGELRAAEQAAVRGHVDECWECRARRRAIEDAITGFVGVHQREFEGKFPPAAGQRALLRAHLAQLSTGLLSDGCRDSSRLPMAAIGLAAAMAVLLVVWARGPQAQAAVVFLPDARLTPGAATLAGRQAVCSLENVKNKAVPAALRRQVFAEYGIKAAAPEAYEVDYLVTPALGGADDLRNLWPHSYAAVWNARVKDDLEDRLRSMVCDGSLELAEAQREIAGNWIEAYKKYFHTERPLD